MGGFALVVLCGAVAPSSAKEVLPPSIRSLVKPAVYERVLMDRDVMVYASIDDPKYSFYGLMLVKASLALTRSVMTNYAGYPELIPYVEKAIVDPVAHTVRLAGGIWRFRLESVVRMEESRPEWIQYEILAGHFTGLKGNFYLESLGEKGTLVYFQGEIVKQPNVSWPPRFVMERGAEIVFGFTGKKMRSYIESQKTGK